MKTVTLPLEEYNKLLGDQEAFRRLLELLDTDAKDRGFLVRRITHMWRKDDDGALTDGYEFMPERNTVEIFSRDKVLEAAQAEIDRLSATASEIKAKADRLAAENERLRRRGLIARVLNTEG